MGFALSSASASTYEMQSIFDKKIDKFSKKTTDKQMVEKAKAKCSSLNKTYKLPYLVCFQLIKFKKEGKRYIPDGLVIAFTEVLKKELMGSTWLMGKTNVTKAQLGKFNFLEFAKYLDKNESIIKSWVRNKSSQYLKKLKKIP